MEQGRRADEQQQEQGNDDRRNDPFRGAKTRHRMLLREHECVVLSDWFPGGSARDPQSPVEAVAEDAVMQTTVRLHPVNSEN